MIRIVLVEDNDIEKEKITEMISAQNDLMIMGLGKDNYDAIKLVDKYKPDIVLIDASREKDEKVEISGILKRYSPETTVVILSASVKDSLIQEMAKGIIKDCLLKELDMGRLTFILRGIYRGEHYINSKISARAFQILAAYYNRGTGTETAEEKHEKIPARFSRAELKILRLIAKGYSGKDIASLLSFKDGTVRNYTSSIIKKARLKNRAQIVLFAQEYGFGKDKDFNACHI